MLGFSKIFYLLAKLCSKNKTKQKNGAHAIILSYSISLLWQQQLWGDLIWHIYLILLYLRHTEQWSTDPLIAECNHVDHSVSRLNFVKDCNIYVDCIIIRAKGLWLFYCYHFLIHIDSSSLNLLFGMYSTIDLPIWQQLPGGIVFSLIEYWNINKT